MLIYLIWQTKNTCRKFLCIPSTITLPCGNIIQTIILHEFESSYYYYPPEIWDNIVQDDINSWFTERKKPFSSEYVWTMFTKNSVDIINWGGHSSWGQYSPLNNVRGTLCVGGVTTNTLYDNGISMCVSIII